MYTGASHKPIDHDLGIAVQLLRAPRRQPGHTAQKAKERKESYEVSPWVRPGIIFWVQRDVPAPLKKSHFAGRAGVVNREYRNCSRGRKRRYGRAVRVNGPLGPSQRSQRWKADLRGACRAKFTGVAGAIRGLCVRPPNHPVKTHPVSTKKMISVSDPCPWVWGTESFSITYGDEL